MSGRLGKTLLPLIFAVFALLAAPALSEAAILITNGSFADATLDENYAALLYATGGASPYTWSLASGSLPPGMEIAAAGTLQGIPTEVGTYAFTLRATDSSEPQQSGEKALSLRVAAGSLTIITSSLPSGTVGVEYSHQLEADGGTEPYEWEIESGALPLGLVVYDDGLIAGIPVLAANVSVNFKVTDSHEAAATATRQLSMVVVDPQSDVTGPSVTGVSTSPARVTQGETLSVTLVGVASDAGKGGSNIIAAEYFIGADPGIGQATPMTAADGEFNSPGEVITATVDTSAWIANTRIYVRAKDAAGNWGALANVLVPLLDAVPPGAITDLIARPYGSLEWVAAAVSDYSSAAQGGTPNHVVDGNVSTVWSSAGTIITENEYVVLDVYSLTRLSGVVVFAPRVPVLFPSEILIEVSQDGDAWTRVGSGTGIKARGKGFLWQFEPLDARYVRVSAPGARNPVDRRYYVQIADVAIYKGGQTLLRLDWTAPADDGYLGDRASSYDVRVSPEPITDENFSAAERALGTGQPALPGLRDAAVVRVGAVTGKVYVAMKTLDDSNNWSAISNVAEVNASVSGFSPVAPEDSLAAGVETPPEFSFESDAALRPTTMVFSSTRDFVPRPTARDDGQIDKTVRFPVRPGMQAWTPTPSQWAALKRIVTTDGVLHWRLEGASAIMNFMGPARALVFDCGEIADLAVSQETYPGSDVSVWPDVDNPPTFSWTDETAGLARFFVDVSTDPAFPMRDRRKTFTLAARGVSGDSHTATVPEWRRVRQLASTSDGALYWRVRAQDLGRAFTYASEPAELYVDGGIWTVSDLDLAAEAPAVSWTRAGHGIVLFSLEFSIDAEFPPQAKYTVKAPAGFVAGDSYALKAGEVRRLQLLAARNGVAELHYRVRGDDAQKAFITRSQSKIVPVPVP